MNVPKLLDVALPRIPGLLNIKIMRRIGIQKIAVLLLGGAMTTATASEPALDTDLLSVNDYFSELPLVFSVSRIDQPINQSPAAVTIIDRDMIDASGARSIADILRLVPGMMVGQKSQYFPVVSYHGLSSRYSRRMQLLVDGRSVYEPSFGGIKWASLPISLEDIERIEVVRGPNAAAYGANAFLGVISITTRTALQDQGAAVKMQKGDQGFVSATARYGGDIGETDFRVSAEKQLDDGFQNLDDDSDKGTVSVRVDSKISSDDLLSIQFGFANADIEQGSNGLTGPRFIDSSSDYVQARWRHDLGNGQEFSINAFRNTYLEKDYWEGGGILYLYDRYAFKKREQIEAKHVLTFGQDHRLVWGAGFRQDAIMDARSLNTQEERHVQMRRLFAHAESHLNDKVLMNAGLMVEDQTLVGTNTSPRLAFNYFATDRQSLRLSVSRAYRNPVMFEEIGDLTFVNSSGTPVYSILTSSGNIKPEVIDSYELGYFWALPALRGSFDAKLYQDDIEMLVLSYFDPGIAKFNFRNLDTAKVRGLELQLDSELSSQIALFANYSYADVDSDDIDGDYTNSVPRHKVSLLLSYTAKNGLRSSMVYHYVDQMDWLDPTGEIDAYDRLDLNFSRGFSISDWSAEWQVSLHNISGDYVDFEPDVVIEPRVYVALKFFQ